MRTHLGVVGALFICAVACGGGSSGGGSGSGGTGGDADSGVDAGTGVDAGGSDAGPGGSSDAGTGGGSDGGTAVNDCGDLMPAGLPMAYSFTTQYSRASEPDYCGLPVADGHGVVAYHTFESGGHPKWRYVTGAGFRGETTQIGEMDFWHGDLAGNSTGFSGYGGSSTTQVVDVEGFDEHANVINGTMVNGSAVFARNLAAGGLFAAGRLAPPGSVANSSTPQVVYMFNADGTVAWGPFPLGSDATVFGAGVDLLGRAVVILDGSAAHGAGSVTARWFGPAGAITSEFQALSGFVPGGNTWFETSELIGSGLALRRMDVAPGDADHLADNRNHTSAWLAILPSGQATSRPAPDWLASRPDTNLQLVRARAAYALLPWTAPVPVCTQSIEILSPTGRSCGKLTFAYDSNPCYAREIRVASDGTVMVMPPFDRETNDPAGSPVFDCRATWYPGGLH